MQALSFVARRGAGMAEHRLFLETSEASSFLVLGNQDISINMARHSVAVYVRSGNDLILNLCDGRQIVLENYFGTTGSYPNRLFLSSNGLIEQVAFEFGPDGFCGGTGQTKTHRKYSFRSKCDNQIDRL